MATKRAIRVAAALVVGVALLTGCEAAVERNLVNLTAPGSPTIDGGLRALARTNSDELCTAGVVTPSADPDADYGPGTVELVDRELVDDELAPQQAGNQASLRIWDRWKTDPVLVAEPYGRAAVGQATCPDGYLYLTLLLQRAPVAPSWDLGVERATAGNATTRFGGLTTDGATIAVSSDATDLVAGGNVPDIFFYDVATGTFTASGIEPHPDGDATIAFSGDGTTLAFAHLVGEEDPEPGESQDLHIFDTATQTTTRLTANFSPYAPLAISDDGGTIAYREGGAGGSSIGLHDIGSGWTEWIFDFVGNPNVSLSATGSFAAANVFGFTAVLDRDTSSTTTLAEDCFADSHPTEAGGTALSGDGRFFAYQCWTGGDLGLYVWDQTTGTSTSVTDDGDGLHVVGAASISDDGRFVVYPYELAAGGTGTYVWDRTTGDSTLIAPVLADAAISGDGSTVAFTAHAPDQPSPAIRDLFVWANPAA